MALRKSTIESFEKAVSKVMASFSLAIPQLAFEIQPDFKRFSEDASPALQPPSIRGAVAEELDRLSAVASTWKARPFFEIALLCFAGIPPSLQTSNIGGHDSGPTPSSVPFSPKRTVKKSTESRSLDESGPADNQRPRISRPECHPNDTDNNTGSNNTPESDVEMQ